MKKILFISNSYGEDATRYLYGVARAKREKIKVMTLYIGGCSLQHHYRNMMGDTAAYACFVNGMATGLHVSIKQALLSDEWSDVVLQQCSPLSGQYETYQPYLTALSDYVHKLVPHATQHLQMTWSFAEGCPRFARTPFAGRAEMIPAVRDAYARAAADIGVRTVPALDAMCKMYDVIGPDTYRDGYHCNLGSARYMLACLWFMVLYGRDVAENGFCDFDTDVSAQDKLLAERCARESLTENGYAVDREG
ncbi:MAG: DUF4886 domain-containing protein [Ruminococcaceae bacterium]|nr:DUF4886 domain-containing protein [Oscillospiraceae bacterium]